MPEQTINLRNPETQVAEEETSPAEALPEAAPETTSRRLTGGSTVLAWDAPEYVVYRKPTAWYVGFGIVLALLLFTAFLLKSFLSGVVFVLAGLLIYVYSERPPRRVHYELRDTGIAISKRVYLYRELAAFNLAERGGAVYVLLRSRRLIMPLIHVPIPESVDPDEVRAVLLGHLPEDTDFTEPLADVLAHWLGF